jgi:hypothetical protein
MKHTHHIIPKHMGGNDEPENLVELTIEEHAEAHRVMFEKYGRWQDKLAWQGLAGMIGKEELIHQMLSEAGKGGAFKTNKGKVGRTRKYPLGTDGRKIRKSRHWFNDGVTEGQYSLEGGPQGWNRGRLKSVMKKTNPHVSL